MRPAVNQRGASVLTLLRRLGALRGPPEGRGRRRRAGRTGAALTAVAAALAADDVHRGREHARDVAHAGRHDQRRVGGVGQLAELLDVVVGHPELHRLEATREGDGLRHAARAVRRRGGDGQDRGGGALGLVDLLLLLGLRGLDHLLLLTLGLVDRRVALALGGEDDGTLLALGAHLLFHRGEDVLGRVDVLDLVAQHLDSPGRRGLVELAHYLVV